MTSMRATPWLGLALLAGLLLPPNKSLAQEPTSPFGQSNAFTFNTNRIGFGETAVMMLSGVREDGRLPGIAALGHPAPNPFNPRVDISFRVGRQGPFELNVYDLAGRRIKNLAARNFEVGQYSEQWDGRDDSGSVMPAGVYLVRIQGESSTDSKKITLVK